MIRSCLEQAPDHPPAAGWSAALTDPAITAALNRMHADPARRWTVAELAAAADLSRSAFARRFTTLTGRPPLAYLGWWRMTLAARLLRQSDAPLSSLARQTGYTSEYAFANAFKREYGIAPGRYRTMPQSTLTVAPAPRWPGTAQPPAARQKPRQAP